MRRLLTCFVICLLLITINTGAQQTVRLNDNWEFLRSDLGGIWEAVRPVVPGNPESVPVWQKVTLPHCVNAYDAVDPDVNYYQGPSWYRTQIVMNNPYKNGRTLLHFEGAGQKTQVYVYDQLVGSHVGGYDEFTVDITDAVAAFKKTDIFTKQFHEHIPVSIRTDNSRDLEMIPSNLSDFNLYGGLYRYLNLVYVPAISIDKIFALATVDNNGKEGKLAIKARWHDPLKINTAAVSIKLYTASGNLLQQATKLVNNTNAEIELAGFKIDHPQLWSPVAPYLYTVEVEVKQAAETYRRKERIAFRHFEFLKNGPFELNGKRLLLKGTHRHEDHAAVGAAMTEEMIRTEMNLIKDMGANFIRLAHYQQSSIVLDICDSLGILVWEEIPWCRGGLGHEVYKEQARRMLTNMIEQHYNHPSIIIWGLGNENDWPGDFNVFDQQKIRSFMTELNQLSHQLDSTRKTAIRRCDFCKDIVDVYSPSIWAGWYRGNYTEYKTSTLQAIMDVDHFFHAEWAAIAMPAGMRKNPIRF